MSPHRTQSDDQGVIATRLSLLASTGVAAGSVAFAALLTIVVSLDCSLQNFDYMQTTPTGTSAPGTPGVDGSVALGVDGGISSSIDGSRSAGAGGASYRGAGSAGYSAHSGNAAAGGGYVAGGSVADAAAALGANGGAGGIRASGRGGSPLPVTAAGGAPTMGGAGGKAVEGAGGSRAAGGAAVGLSSGAGGAAVVISSGAGGAAVVISSGAGGAPAVAGAGGARYQVAAGGSSMPAGSGGSGPAGSFAGGDANGAGGSCDLCLARAALVHRYGFEGTGTAVLDSVGSAHGTVMNASLSGTGTVAVSNNAYVEFPAGILSSLTDATLELWLIWNGGLKYQRILDFGDSSADSSGTVLGRTFVLLSPACPTKLRGGYRLSTAVDIAADGYAALPQGVLQHIALVLTDATHVLDLYLNGGLVATAGGIQALSNIHDVHNWLGRSQYATDPAFNGTYYEFRVYGAALSASQIAASRVAGPDD